MTFTIMGVSKEHDNCFNVRVESDDATEAIRKQRRRD